MKLHLLGLSESTHVNPGSINGLFLTKIQTAFVIYFSPQNQSVVRIKNSHFHSRWTEPLTPRLL